MLIDWNQIIIEYMVQEYDLLRRDINDIDMLIRSTDLISNSLTYKTCCYKIATYYGYSQRSLWYHQSQIISRYIMGRYRVSSVFYDTFLGEPFES